MKAFEYKLTEKQKEDLFDEVNYIMDYIKENLSSEVEIRIRPNESIAVVYK
jgi:hypothetical protein